VQTALNVNAQPASDETHGGHRYKVSLHFSVVKDLTMDQYRKLVMQWLCSRSKGSSLDDESEHSPPLDGKKSVRDVSPVGIGDISSAPVDAVPSYASHVGFTSVPSRLGPLLPQLTASTGTKGEQTVPSFTGLIRRGIAPPRGFIRTHHGAVSQATVTTGVPIEIMRHVRDVLVRMGVEVQIESDYKHRCVRAKKRRAPPTPSGTGLGLRGDPEVTPSPILSPGELASEPVYGDPSQDLGVEVRFYVELTKLESSLKDTYSIDIRRLKGHLRSYKFLYDYITQCVFFFWLRIEPWTLTFISQAPRTAAVRDDGGNVGWWQCGGAAGVGERCVLIFLHVL
jgi:protein-serine/threonine kinase